MSDGLKVVGLNAFDQSVKHWLGAVEKQAADAAVGLAKQVFSNILMNSPQYSGDYTAGWGVGYNQIVSNFREGVFPDKTFPCPDPFGRGDMEPINHAKANANWGTLALGQTIYISNDAHHDQNYAWLIENGQINFRAPNMGASNVARGAIRKIGNRFHTLTKSNLDALRNLPV